MTSTSSGPVESWGAQVAAEDQRTAALQRVARLASTLLDVPLALVSAVDEERHRVRASTGLPDELRATGELPMTHSLCKHVVAGGEALLIPDTASSELVEARRAAADLDVGSYAGVPIRGAGGEILGTVCVADDHKREWSPNDATILDELAEVAALELELRQSLRSARDLDGLTGLPNRTSCTALVRELQLVAHSRFSGVAILVVDMARLGLINDSLGRGAGDAFLVAVGRRLAQDLSGVAVARVGGNQFAVVTDARDERVALELADTVRELLQQPFEVDGHEITPSATIGIAIGEPGDGAADLLDAACAAVRPAKQAPNDVAITSQPFRDRAAARLRFDVALRRAIRTDEFTVHYQPLYDLRRGRLSGFEALSRWTSPELGPVSPVDFIPAAEESGLIAVIGQKVLEQACRDAVAWRDLAPGRPPGVSVNVSTRQLTRDLPQQVADVLERAGLPARSLTLEITESSLISEDGSASAILAELHEVGVHLALDDFGTGYSSLSQLARLPLDVLKIDRSFVLQLDDPRTLTIVAATVAMGRSLGLSVTAEGIETPEVRDRLADMGCTHGQGFGLGRPADVTEARARVARDTWPGTPQSA